MKILSNNTFINVFCSMVKYIFALISNSLCLFSDAMYDSFAILKESSLFGKDDNKKKKNRQSIYNIIVSLIAIAVSALVVLNVFSISNYKVKWYVVLVSLVAFLLSNLSNSLKYVIGYNNENQEIINVNRSFKYVLYFPIIVVICYLLTLLKKYVSVFKYADVAGAVLISLITVLIAIKHIYNNLHHVDKVDDKIDEIFKNQAGIKAVKSEVINYGYSKKVIYKLSFDKNVAPINMYSNLVTLCNSVFTKYSDVEVVSIIKNTYVERKMVSKNARNSRSRNSKKNTTKKNTKQKNKKR